MRTLERGRNYESLDASIARIAYAYGFTNSPVPIVKKSAAVSDDLATGASAALTLGAARARTKADPAVTVAPTQVWGSARAPKGGTLLSFAILSSRHAVANALVVEAARAVAELAGFTDLTVLVSSVGDQESSKRFTRELANFFRKNSDAIPQDIKHEVVRDPDLAYRALLKSKDPLLERAPHPIDYLSENSRKTMLETLSLFESIGIPYSIEPHLSAEQGFNTELLFAIEGTRRGERVRIATGGRFDEYLKRAGMPESAVSISVAVPDRVEPEAVTEAPTCFVVHVGDAAKLKTFTVLAALWRAHINVTNGLLAESLREQMLTARSAGTRYVAIIGQREALDDTVIVRNIGTDIQSVIPADSLTAYITRKH